MLAEVDVDNQDGTLAPGIYTIVRLDEPRLYPVISVQSQAIIFDKDGLQAAVDDNGMVRLRHRRFCGEAPAAVLVTGHGAIPPTASSSPRSISRIVHAARSARHVIAAISKDVIRADTVGTE